MAESLQKSRADLISAAAIAAGVIFLYAQILAKLVSDWWSDENYSHGLLIPFVIGSVIWKEWGRLRDEAGRGSVAAGVPLIVLSFFLLLVGTLGAELFSQRVSLVVMIAGLVIYLFGTRVVGTLAVPFLLFLLSIPIPQIIFNRIAFPLQIMASQAAVWAIRLLEVPTLRNGNVIDILPRGSTQTISLEVVEACSGIRSLMTLITLAVVLVYFTRRDRGKGSSPISQQDLWRTILLMAAAVPIAVLTNAGRVAATGVLTYYYGKQATDSTWHSLGGFSVYLVALLLLAAGNYLLKRVFRPRMEVAEAPLPDRGPVGPIAGKAVVLVIALLIGGIAVNWFENRSEIYVERASLRALPATLGDWKQRGDEIKFDDAVLSILRTSDHTMREYSLPDGRVGNIYVGYYSSQRTGATYHSPQNCLPGAGWVMSDPQVVEVAMAGGGSFKANRYIVKNGVYNEIMIYWYQGRGRIEASEYTDKINTVWDSITRRRTDGALVRVMTSVGFDEAAATSAALDLSSKLEAALPAFIPE